MESDPASTSKRVRNQNACDLCRSRRVKCRFTEGSATCDGCQALDVECRSDRPRRKRGPVNRHAEAHRRATAAVDPPHPEQQQSPDPVARLPSQELCTHHDSPPSAASQTPGSLPASSPHPAHARLGLSALGSEDVVRRLLNDWFEYIHPVAPILHRRRLLARLRRGDAETDPVFCGLIIATCSATVSTLSRKSFTDFYGTVTVEKCLNLIFAGQMLPHDHHYSVDWCIARYHCVSSMIRVYSMDSPDFFRLLTECQAGVKYMIAYRMQELPLFEQEMLKRLYWLVVIGLMTFDLLGRPYLGMLSLTENSAALRPQPFTDLQLDSDPALQGEVPAWHGDTTSYVPGLNYVVDVFFAWHQAQLDTRYYTPQETLGLALGRVRETLDRLPPELRWRGGMSRPLGATAGHDTQIANIFVTGLHIRSNLLQRLGSPSSKEHQMIVGDLLEVLQHLPKLMVEANGYSLIPKIRDIGAAYLEELHVSTDFTAVEETEKTKLASLIQKLDVLDFRPDQHQTDSTESTPENPPT